MTENANYNPSELAEKIPWGKVGEVIENANVCRNTYYRWRSGKPVLPKNERDIVDSIYKILQTNDSDK